jgi:hypothetical protein
MLICFGGVNCPYEAEEECMVVFFLVRLFRGSGSILWELRRKKSWEQCQQEYTRHDWMFLHEGFSFLDRQAQTYF